MKYYKGKVEAVRIRQDSSELRLIVDDNLEDLRRQRCREVQVGIDDGRTISPAQRRKAYATLLDIGDYTGYAPEEIKQIMKIEHMLRVGDQKVISLSDCTMTDAREFINTLMEYALKEGIILTESGLMRTDDIDCYLIQCIRYRRCCICGKPADIHHVDAIGMGRNRQQVDDSSHEIAALCRMHHTISHQMGWDRFADSYHVYGIRRDRTEVDNEQSHHK